jgi:hypothetical protein
MNVSQSIFAKEQPNKNTFSKIIPKIVYENLNLTETELMQAVKNGAKDIVQLDWNSGVDVIVKPKTIKTLFTYGLGGCQGTLLLAKCKDGNSLAIMTHFDALHDNENLKCLKQLIAQNKELIDNKFTPKVFYLVPGRHIKTIKGYYNQIISPEIIEKLSNGIYDVIKNFDEEIMTYNLSNKFEKSRAFIVNFNSINPSNIDIKTVGNNFKSIKL